MNITREYAAMRKVVDITVTFLHSSYTKDYQTPGGKSSARCLLFAFFLCLCRRILILLFDPFHIAWLITFPMVSAASRFMSAVACV